MENVLLKTDTVTITTQFNHTEAARKIVKALPLSSRVQTWGEEIYFSIPVHVNPAEKTRSVTIGDVGYWPDGNCLCIFFGRTPMSTTDKPVPASPVSIVGKVTAGIEYLKTVKDNEHITVMKGEGYGRD